MNNSIQRILFLLVALFSVMAATPAKSETEKINKSFSVKSGGTIEVEGCKGSVRIDSSGGNLFVGSSGGPVKAKTSGGNIKILQANGFIEADSSGGKIEAEMIIDDKKVDTHVDLDSSGGSITLHIPEILAASLSATLKITHSAKRDYRIY